MKLGRRFKTLLLACSALLYASGLAVWIAATLLWVDNGYGPEPSPWKAPLLHAHSVAGLVFLALFGYLWSAHVEPGLRQKKKRRSGLTMLGAFAVMFATVPPLFYATGEPTRAAAAAVHTWLGALLLAPFLLHLRAKKL